MNDITLMLGNCLERLKELPDNSVDSIVTDPPYGLSFMGKKWDYDVPSVEIWEECLRVLKPGGHLLAFAGTRTQHRMAVRIEDAGFEIRDMIAWVYGSGFPKSLDVSKAIDKAAGAERKVVSEVKTNSGGMAHISKTNAEHGFRPNAYTGNSEDKSAKNVIQVTEPSTDSAKQWEGWGTALKPALEPITVARKPISEKTIAENVLKHGTGGINIDRSRVSYNEYNKPIPQLAQGKTKVNSSKTMFNGQSLNKSKTEAVIGGSLEGRFPANLIHDGSDEVVELFPITKSGAMKKEVGEYDGNSVTGFMRGVSGPSNQHGDSGSAARFFYCAKTSKKDRDEGLESFQEKKASGLPLRSKDMESNGEGLDGTKTFRETTRKNVHPTVKPTELMRYLVKLVTPPNGVVLDPFMGSGSTGKAAKLEGFKFIGVELDPEYLEIAKARIEAAQVKKTLEGFFTDDDS